MCYIYMVLFVLKDCALHLLVSKNVLEYTLDHDYEYTHHMCDSLSIYGVTFCMRCLFCSHLTRMMMEWDA